MADLLPATIVRPAWRETVDRIAGQPAIRRSLPALGMLGVVGAAVLTWSTLSAAPQRALFATLADTDKAAVAEGLKGANVPYKVDAATGALSVSSDDYYRARMLLAAQGLPKSAPGGAATLETMPMGASHAVETERLRDAREADLARTIEAIDAVESARVHIAEGEGTSFLRDSAPASASVMLTLKGGGTLGAQQVQGIVRLVAASIPGMSPDHVAITDQRGNLLTDEGGDPLATAAARQLDIQNKVEARYRRSLDDLLTPIVGAGNFTAEIHADLDFAENQSTRETYPQTDRAVAREESRWTSDAGEAPAVGIPGALSNTPPPASSLSTTPPSLAPPAANPGRTSENSERNYALGREVSVTRAASGTVRRLSVAVAIKSPAGGKARSQGEIQQIDNLVRNAVGFDQARGDSVAVTSRAFAPEDAASVTPWYQAGWLAALGRYAAALAAIAILAFGVGRPFLKARARDAEARRALIAPMLEAEIERQGAREADGITLDMITAAPSYAARADLVRDFVTQDPKRAAAVVKTLLAAE